MQKLSATINGLRLSTLLPTPRVIANRNKIQSLGNKIISLGKETPSMPVKHFFAKGVYIREIFMPAGSVVVGKIHTTEHFNEIVSGECIVFTADEEFIRRKAGDIFVSKAGVQKALRCLTDVVWRTVHATDDTDIETNERKLAVDRYEDLEADQLMLERARIGI